jgi:Zn-dependent peptidase ImmA (M78 family)
LNNTYPEIQIARRISKKYRIAPGFDIRRFAQKFLDINEENIPFSVDALFLGLGTDTEKPKLILNSRTFYRRQRFTLAHELGHHFIPWHAGLIICHIDPEYRLRNYLYEEMEGEANRFASELIMPEAWIIRLIEKNKKIKRIVEEIYDTGVSYIAANIALSRLLPPGYLFVQTDNDDMVEYSGRSKGSGITSPSRGEKFDHDLHKDLISQHCIFENSSNKSHWFKFKRSILKPQGKKDHRDSKEIIRSFLEATVPNKDRRLKILQKINGIIGATNSMHSFSKDTEMLSFLCQRFSSNEELRHLLDSKEFELFLSKKSEELCR